jgi:hypothetical protein
MFSCLYVVYNECLFLHFKLFFKLFFVKKSIKLKFFKMFLNDFNVLILKIIKKNLKNIILEKYF